MEQPQNYHIIDLREILYILLRKAWIVAASLLAGAVFAFGVTKLLITPQYTASSMIYIFTKTTSITSLTDLQIGSQITVDFQTIATTRPVVEGVIANLRLDTTYEELVDTISVSTPTNSRIIKLSVENPDPALAADISNALSAALSTRIADIMNTDKPSIVEDAVVPQKPTSPSTMRNTAIGGVFAALCAMGIILILYYLDDTIKTAEDVKQFLDINTLASIPEEQYKEKGDGQPAAKRKKAPAGVKLHSSGAKTAGTRPNAASAAHGPAHSTGCKISTGSAAEKNTESDAQ